MLYNNWFGKAVGATCAWIWAPTDAIWLAAAVITGIGLGHLYDLWAAHMHDGEAASLAQINSGNDSKAAPYAEFLFAALGRIAKASGRVTPDHIAHAERVMQQMGMDAAGKTQAQRWFRQGKSGDAALSDLSRECLAADQKGSAARLTILRCLCAMAAITPSDSGVSTLKSLGGLLGFAPSRIAGEFGAYHDARHQAEHNAGGPQGSGSELDAAYRQLDLQPGATLDQVKRAYRRLVSRTHPDKLPRDASDAEQRAAQERMVKLRDAFERISAAS